MRTRFTFLLAFLLIATCGPSFQAKQPARTNPALLNADFAAPLDSGWSSSARNLAGYHKTERLSDRGVKVSKVQCGHNRLSQQVTLTGLDAVFRARAQLHAETNQSGYHAYAAITLSYLDAEGNELGLSRFYTLAGAKPWPDTPQAHYIPVSKPGQWLDLSLSLAQELKEHLPGVNADKVKALRVTLESFGSGTSSC